MKKIIYILLLFLATGSRPATAQRCIPGQMGMQLSAGLTDGLLLRNRHGAYTFWADMALVRYNRNRTHWSFGVSLLRKDYPYAGELIPKLQYTTEAGYYIPLAASRGRGCILSAGLSGLAGYERINAGQTVLSDGASLSERGGFIGGGTLAAELAAFFGDRLALLVTIKERCYFGSTVGNFHTQLGFGIRVTIN